MNSVIALEQRSAYRGASVALLTRHGKERVLSPLFREALDARVSLLTSYDTDLLGTFTREVPRAGSQLDAARKKAQLASEISGLPLAVASEGSFGPGLLGIGVWNLELVIFIDVERGLEVVGRTYAPGHHHHALVRDFEELHRAAHAAGFPEHALVLRPDTENGPPFRKGIRSWRELDREFLNLKRESASGTVFVENDLRAHVHPTRMANIAAAAGDLVQRLRRRCPKCEAPGFGVIRTLEGLPCRDCGEATAQAQGEELGCVACDAREHSLRSDARLAEPFQCNTCNP